MRPNKGKINLFITALMHLMKNAHKITSKRFHRKYLQDGITLEELNNAIVYSIFFLSYFRLHFWPEMTTPTFPSLPIALPAKATDRQMDFSCLVEQG